MTKKPGFTVLQQAANWYAELQDNPSSAAFALKLQQWLDEDEENQQAWQYVLSISQRFNPLRESENRQTVAVTALTTESGFTTRRQLLKMGALLSVGSLLGWTTWRYTPLRQQMLALNADYHSSVGQIRQVVLSDGSRVWLDTNTSLNADYASTRRDLTLLHGRVMIATAADPRRTLTLSSEQGKMRALGTRFSAGSVADTTLLQVYEGAVEVSPTASKDVLIVKAGQALSFHQKAIGAITPLAGGEPAWTRGLLQADNLPLGEFVRQLAPYRHGYLACDPASERLTVTGTFPLHDTDRALSMLTRVLPVRIRQPFSWWTTIEKQP